MDDHFLHVKHSIMFNTPSPKMHIGAVMRVNGIVRSKLAHPAHLDLHNGSRFDTGLITDMETNNGANANELRASRVFMYIINK